MTPEKALSKITDIINTLPETEASMARKMIHSNERTKLSMTWALLACLAIDLREEIAVEQAKKAGKHNIRAAALRVLKCGDSRRPATQYSYTDNDGIQWVCDGQRMLRFTEPMDLPVLPQDITPFDYKKHWDFNISDITAEVELPSLAVLRSFIRTYNAEHKSKYDKPYYDFGDGFPVVDAVYLADCMAAVPDATMAKVGKFNAIFIEGKRSAAFLLPIRNPKRNENNLRKVG